MIFVTLIFYKNVYDEKNQNDGKWVLVERLWPRGIKKEKVDIWIKDVAPSKELRKWYSHDVQKWEEFRLKYREELNNNPKVKEILELLKKEKITIVYATRDYEHSSARVLIEYLESFNI